MEVASRSPDTPVLLHFSLIAMGTVLFTVAFHFSKKKKAFGKVTAINSTLKYKLKNVLFPCFVLNNILRKELKKLI